MWPDLLVQASAPEVQPEVMLTAGFAWFQLLMTGSYLGAAGALVERVLLNNRVPESERIGLLVEAEGAMAAAEGVARRIDDGGIRRPSQQGGTACASAAPDAVPVCRG
ncbi:hypothetical protein [Nonomuraea angiospora]